jgi:two-component sensor histidine kinase
MALILGVVLLLPCAYAIVQAVQVYQESRQRLVDTLQRTADLIALRQVEFFQETRGTLERLAATPELAAGGPQCAALLISEVAQNPQYGDFALTDGQGIVSCSSSSSLLGVDLSERAYFEDLRDQKQFVVSEVLAAREDRGRIVVAALPLLDETSNALRGALSVTIDLGMLDARMGRVTLPENAVMILADQEGRLLTSNLRFEEASEEGLPTPEEISGLIRAASAGLRTEGVDRIERRYVVRPVSGTPINVLLGLPAPDDWSWLQRDLLQQILAPAVMLALAVAVIWFATDLLVNRHVAALVRTARRYARGQFEAEPRLAGAPSELEELGGALTGMARHIQEREAELKRSLEHKDALLRETHHRVKNSLQVVTSLLNLRVRGVPPSAGREAMLEALIRIKALALVHRSLYEHDDLHVVDLGSLVGDLCELLRDSAEPYGARVALTCVTRPLQASTDKAIPIVLLITEAVTNAFKHAFPHGRRGSIEIRLEREGALGRLRVADDGVGFAAARAARRSATDQGRGDPATATPGLQLMDMLTKQIGGRLSIDGPSGTRSGTTVALDFEV